MNRVDPQAFTSGVSDETSGMLSARTTAQQPRSFIEQNEQSRNCKKKQLHCLSVKRIQQDYCNTAQLSLIMRTVLEEQIREYLFFTYHFFSFLSTCLDDKYMEVLFAIYTWHFRMLLFLILIDGCSQMERWSFPLERAGSA